MRLVRAVILLGITVCFLSAASGAALAVHLHCEHHGNKDCGHNHDNGPDPDHCPLCKELLAITISMHLQFNRHFAEILPLPRVVCAPNILPDAVDIRKPFDSRPPPSPIS